MAHKCIGCGRKNDRPDVRLCSECQAELNAEFDLTEPNLAEMPEN